VRYLLSRLGHPTAQTPHNVRERRAMIGERIEVNIAGGLDAELPRMIRVRQKFETPTEDDVAAAVLRQFQNPEIRERIKPGMRIAVGCGSRSASARSSPS
jgi:hypothetical protein